MYLIVVLLALAFLQIWGAKNPLHKDEIFTQWLSDTEQWPLIRQSPKLHIVWVLLVPVAAVIVISLWLPSWLWLIVSTIILLYSLGRGEFASLVEPYSYACSDNHWEEALKAAKGQGVDLEGIKDDDWPDLHQKMLSVAAYQGFERMFAVLFWFILFGPAGALLYRLSFLFAQKRDDVLSERWLWALEWPAVRVLGASFAVTGNFVGCINRWKIYILCQASESAYILRETVLGALSVDDELMQSCDCTQREISALKRLYTRTLWFWVGAIALWSIVY